MHLSTTGISMARLILASGSPQRRQLLADAGYDFEVIVPDQAVECGVCSTGGPASLVGEIALRKASDVVQKITAAGTSTAKEEQNIEEQIIIACDTLAECGGEVLGKPNDEQHARAMLKLLEGQRHRVYSGLCIWKRTPSTATGQPEVRIAVTELVMDALSDVQIEEYLATDLWQGKAGAFGYQDRPGWLHIRQGTESNVIGLPMELLTEMLATPT